MSYNSVADSGLVGGVA